MDHPASTIGRSAPFALRFWIVFCAFWNLAGWILSAIGFLNRTGYAIAFFLLAGGIVYWGRSVETRPFSFSRLKRRFARGFPAAFMVVASMAILGGLLYAPSNPDGLTQRVPRLLNWLAAGQWHWIENAPTSFNTRATGFEWIMAPVIALTGTDRFVFLLNVFGFLLMPGLVFSVFRCLGVRSRVAWHWMWIAPTGYCFLLQAGSIANDMAGAVLALAALDFALRARRSGRDSDTWNAILAAALMTNAKSSNLTLLLPWALAMLPSVRVLLKRPFCTALVCLAGAAVSLIPVTWFNIHRLGDWSGAGTEAPLFDNLTPGVAFAGNALNLAAQNFAPPFFPMAGWWNEHFHRILPSDLVSRMEACFEPGGAHIKLLEMQLEVAAGLGLGVSLLLLLSVSWGWFCRQGKNTRSRRDAWAALIRWAAWVSLLVYMVKTGLSTSARIITPYYAMLMPALLAGAGQGCVVRRKLWRTLALLVFPVAALVLAMNPGRPLWPARTVFAELAQRRPNSEALRKAALLYESYARRWDALAPIKKHLPAGVTNAGLISFLSASSIETSLWRPFGSRRIWWLRPDSSRAEMDRKGIEYVLVGSDGPDARKAGRVFNEWFGNWLRESDAVVVAAEPVQLLATGPPGTWYLARLKAVP